MAAGREREFLWPAAVIFAFNLALVGHLVTADRLIYRGSIEGAFIGLARFLSHHPNPFGWYPYWYGGTPIQFTYTPGLHYLNALVMRLLPFLSAGQAYHAVSAVMYSLGSVTAAYLAYFFTRERWWALGAGMLYSLWTPALWLIRAVRLDSGDFHAPWRLQVLAKYGEGPHIASLALLPLAVCALWRVAERRGFRPMFVAAALMAALVLCNWVGAFALGATFLCFLLTIAWRNPGFGPPLSVRRALAAAGLAYLLAAFWITPSFVRTVAFNAQTVSGHYEYHFRMLILLAGALAGLGAIRMFFFAFPEHLYLCFLSLATFFFGYLTLCSYWFRLYMIPQPHRYLPEFELFLVLLVCEKFRLAYQYTGGWARRGVVAAMAVLAALAVHQARDYLPGSYLMLRPAWTADWAEYKLDAWLAAHAKPEDRVFIVGSEGISLNGWFDVAQVKGWFDPGVRERVILDLCSQISSGENAPPGRAGAIAVDLLHTIGARYVVVHTTRSKVAYHDFPRPEKFEGLLPQRFRLPTGEAIYEVPGARLAVLARPEEIPAKRPVNGLDIGPLERYIAAVGDSSRPPLTTRWLGPNRLEVRGDFPAGRVVSLRVSYAEGWRA
ncbi:MAG TPA: hypothetical protein VEU62_09765, partial [Bryobacterales bacterium]|nr:hypothetical protein [Bryobacterales bacterium]